MRFSLRLVWMLMADMIGYAMLWAAAGIAVFYVGDVFENLDQYLRRGATAFDLAAYFLLRTPEIFFQTAPLTIGLAALTYAGRFAASNEITAIESVGISPRWVWGVALAVAASVSVADGLYQSTVIETVAELLSAHERRLDRDSSSWGRTDQPYLFEFTPTETKLIIRGGDQQPMVATVRIRDGAPVAVTSISDRTYQIDFERRKVSVSSPGLTVSPEVAAAVERTIPMQYTALGDVWRQRRTDDEMQQQIAIETFGRRAILIFLPMFCVWIGLRGLRVHGRGAGGFGTLGFGVARVVGAWGLVVAAAVLASGRGDAAWQYPMAVILTFLPPWWRIVIPKRRHA